MTKTLLAYIQSADNDDHLPTTLVNAARDAWRGVHKPSGTDSGDSA